MVIWARPRTARRRWRNAAPRERRMNASSSRSATVVANRAGRIAGTFEAIASMTAAYLRRFFIVGVGTRFNSPTIAERRSTVITRSLSPSVPVSLKCVGAGKTNA